MTSGKGMMKFSRGFMRFGRDLPIVPAAMRAQSSFGISTHTLSSSFLANMFWCVPAPHSQCRVLKCSDVCDQIVDRACCHC